MFFDGKGELSYFYSELNKAYKNGSIEKSDKIDGTTVQEFLLEIEADKKNVNETDDDSDEGTLI